jgi:hypothetical protein
MRAGKSLACLLLTALGVVGIIVCLAGIGGVWIGASRLQRLNTESATTNPLPLALFAKNSQRIASAPFQRSHFSII